MKTFSEIIGEKLVAGKKTANVDTTTLVAKIQNILIELRGIDPSELSKAERNILRKLEDLLSWVSKQ